LVYAHFKSIFIQNLEYYHFIKQTFNMNMLSNAIKCVNCKNVLDSPVLLPCSHSICKKHVTDGNKGAAIFCNKCGLEHSIPQNGFPIQEALAEIIQSQIGNINFGKDHQEANDACTKFDECLNKFEQLLKDPLNFTHEVILSLKDVVQLRGEEAKLKIDLKMNYFFDKLEEYEKDCEKALKMSEYVVKSETINLEIEAFRKELEKWQEHLDKFNFYKQEWDKIKSESENAVKQLKSQQGQFEIDLLLQERFDQFRDDIAQEFGEFEINIPEISFILE
jgi:hypothetical protein